MPGRGQGVDITPRAGSAMRAGTAIRAGTVLRIGVTAGVGLYLISRLATSEPSLLVDWIGYSTLVLCAALSAWIAGERPDADRLGSRLLALAIAAWGVGVFIQGYDQFVLDQVPYPSWADAGYLLFVPLAFLALGRLLIQSRSISVGDMLEAAVVGLAVVSLGAAIALQPSVTALQGDRFATFTQLMYPVSDIVLLGAVLGMATAQGFRVSPRAAFLAAGLIVFSVGDAVYFMRAVQGTYTTGTLLDASWAVGLLLLSEAPWRPSWTTPRRPHWGASMAATVLAMGVAVLILVHGAMQAGTLMWFVAVPATATLVVAVIRLGWSVREVQRSVNESTLAREDPLTGLPNRRAFIERMDELIRRDRPFDVLLVDLDRFKEINDVLGHGAGDQLLSAVADRLARARVPGAFLSRIGGDEFGVIAPLDDGAGQARAILDCLDAAFEVEGIPLRVGASIGVAAYPDHASSGGDMLRHADVAMYRAKRNRLGFATYDATVDQIDANRLTLATELASAAASQELALWFQPVVDNSGRIIAVEALVRWVHPRLGLLLPWVFLPIAQQVGVMRQLSENVVAQAVRAAGALHRHGFAHRVWVNLDSADLPSSTLPAIIREQCGVEGIAPSALGVEITEDALVSGPESARAGVERLRELGIAVAIDDFGTGYSSLAYLQHLPVTHLKIDRTFVHGLLDPAPDVVSRSRAVTSTIIELGHQLGIRVVAEGVESDDQMEELVALDCDAMQGYLFGQPMPLDGLLARLAKEPTARGTLA